MSNGDFAVTMYESDPMVAALNKVPGFDPLKLVSRKRIPGAEKDEKNLDFRYKKLWFRLAHRTGRIRLNRLSITEQLAIIEAQVYLELTDANPVSSFTAACTREEGGDKYIESAQIRAMDQALTDAGFGLQFVAAPVESTEGTAVRAAEVHQKASVQTASQQHGAIQPSAAQPQAAQQRPVTVQQPAVQQTTMLAKNAQTAQVQVQSAQAGQKGVQEAAVTVSTPQTAAQRPVSAEVLPAGQPPVPTEAQELPVTSDVATAMSMLSGKPVGGTEKEEEALSVAPESTKATEKAESMPEELPVPPATTVAGETGVPTDSDTASLPAPVANANGTAKGGKPYTEETPVEEILQSMTLEDAKKVVVPTGTCRGWTLDEVAQRRRPSLRFYLSEAYQGRDNILRAGARLMLDDLEKKAG